MSSGSLRRIPARWRFTGAAFVALLAMFGVGAFTGTALSGGGDGERPVTRINFTADAGAPRGGPITVPASAGDGDAPGIAEGEPHPRDLRYYGNCQGPLPAGTVGSVIDPSAAGISMKLLGPGFVLQSIALRGEGECDKDGLATDVIAVLETGWVHTATGVTVMLTQRPSPEVANYLDEYTAMVWADGYLFQLSAWGGMPVPVSEPFAADGASDLDDTTASSPVSHDVPSSSEVRQVLREAMAQLAPGVSERCFYRMEVGGWDALAGFGIGDPRPAIPSGYTDDYVSVRALVAPDNDCGQPVLEGYYGSGFDAAFSDGSGGWIGVSAYERYPDNPQSFYAHEGSIAWSDSRWQYNVNGYGPAGPLAMDTLQAIALALVPSLDLACLPADRQLAVDDILAAGFREPVVPDGYTLDSRQLVLNAVGEDCADNTGAGISTYRLSWTFLGDGGARIEVGVHREAGGAVEPGYGWVGEGSAWWTSGDGTWYSVNAHLRDGAPLSRDEVIAIALSLDPQFAPSTLDGSIPKPLPEDVAPAAPR